MKMNSNSMKGNWDRTTNLTNRTHNSMETKYEWLTRTEEFNVHNEESSMWTAKTVWHDEDSSYKTKTVHVHDENQRRQGAGDHNISKLQLKLNGWATKRISKLVVCLSTNGERALNHIIVKTIDSNY